MKPTALWVKALPLNSGYSISPREILDVRAAKIAYVTGRIPPDPHPWAVFVLGPDYVQEQADWSVMTEEEAIEVSKRVYEASGLAEHTTRQLGPLRGRCVFCGQLPNGPGDNWSHPCTGQR